MLLFWFHGCISVSAAVPFTADSRWRTCCVAIVYILLEPRVKKPGSGSACDRRAMRVNVGVFCSVPLGLQAKLSRVLPVLLAGLFDLEIRGRWAFCTATKRKYGLIWKHLKALPKSVCRMCKQVQASSFFNRFFRVTVVRWPDLLGRWQREEIALKCLYLV